MYAPREILLVLVWFKVLDTDLADIHKPWSEFGHHHNRVILI